MPIGKLEAEKQGLKSKAETPALGSPVWPRSRAEPADRLSASVASTEVGICGTLHSPGSRIRVQIPRPRRSELPALPAPLWLGL